ncbi:neuronal acetylcholine receptor subunit alpha-10-like isoform X2 [Ptychodera flava]|uniref:neuronal acetylcholine receptor subunit alpha-10-like isoform X2 n=1 Tax=Ptychodera flava TaxID=63121 RepID=UPI00396A7B9D
MCSLEGAHTNIRSILAQNLLKDYNTFLRPVYNLSTITNVTFGLALTQIIDMDERNQRITINVWLRQNWKDEFLAWNVSEFAGVNEIRLPAESVWRPDIVLYNNVDEEFAHIKMDTLAIVSADGGVFWMAPAILKSSCKVEVLHFPFDKQYCTLKFGSWAYHGWQMELISRDGDNADIGNYMNNGEWDLVSAPVKRNVQYYGCCIEPFPDLTFTIILRRRPLFYVFNLLVPNCLIACLTLVGFYLPPDSGEKVTMVITNLLGLIVFHQFLAESLPPTSDKVPLIALYFSAMILLVSLSCVLTIWVLNLHFQDGYNHEVPKWVKRLVFGFLARILRIQKAPKHEENCDISLATLREISQDLGNSESPKRRVETVMGNSHHERVPKRCFYMDNNRFYYKRVRTRGDEPQQKEQSKEKNSPKLLVLSTQSERDINEILTHVKQFSRRMASKDKRNHTLREWKEVAHVVDRVLLVVFAILFSTVTIALVVSATG